MAYVRTRTTKAGTPSTALVEAYRDKQGRPRQRLLASLHGEPSTLRALARLAVRRTKLLAERKELASGKMIDDETGEVIDATFAREVIALIDTELIAALAREQAVLEKHCTATAKEVRAATKTYERELRDAVAETLGRILYLGQRQYELKKAKAKVKRMRGG